MSKIWNCGPAASTGNRQCPWPTRFLATNSDNFINGLAGNDTIGSGGGQDSAAGRSRQRSRSAAVRASTCSMAKRAPIRCRATATMIRSMAEDEIDLMVGGAGDDTYFVRESSDKIVEAAGAWRRHRYGPNFRRLHDGCKCGSSCTSNSSGDRCDRQRARQHHVDRRFQRETQRPRWRSIPSAAAVATTRWMAASATMAYPAAAAATALSAAPAWTS